VIRTIGIATALTFCTIATAVAQDVDHGGHAVHDRAINFQVLFDQLEWQFVHGEPGYRWDSRSWIGGDRNRLWIRTEGDAVDGTLDTAEAQVLFGRSFSRWWEIVGGVRFDARPAPSHTWFAIGVQGLAPQFLDVQATAFIGQSGHTAARIEIEHDLLLTQRLILQPLVELSLSGKDDPDRGISAGLSTGEVGFRIRYEIRRELAPYAGVVWHRKLFGTGDAAREDGEDAGGWHLVSGLRFWF
jgi:copper resistance protein B